MYKIRHKDTKIILLRYCLYYFFAVFIVNLLLFTIKWPFSWYRDLSVFGGQLVGFLMPRVIGSDVSPCQVPT